MPATGAGRRALPLDYESRGYAYLERPNVALLDAVARHFPGQSRARVLDVGCGAGANARALRQRASGVFIAGLEPEASAAELARPACDELFQGTLEDWFAQDQGVGEPFDAVILSDVIEHVVEPVRALRGLLSNPRSARALYFVSVPNYAVWYNRAKTLIGRFDYSWSGLYDRTHLRFFTKQSIASLIEYTGFELIEQSATPSLVQSAAPLLRRWFERDVDRGEHLGLTDSPWFRAYSRYFEPFEARLCSLWPELLAFQIVSVARPRRGEV